MAINLGINDLKELSEVLSEKLGLDFTQYGYSFFKRRLSYIFDLFNIKKKSQFQELLKVKEFHQQFFYNFAVNNTEMFRDPGFWRFLKTLTPAFQTKNEINIWFPEASSGEEVFSFLIYAKEQNILEKVKVFCNHTSHEKLNEIEKGILKNKNLELNKSNYKRFEGKSQLENYFSIDNTGVYLKPELTAPVETITHSFLQGDTPKNITLVIYRNAMLNYNKKYCTKCMDVIYDSLVPGGMVAIGIKESMPFPYNTKMTCMNQKEMVFKKDGFLN
ncbi:hypothetical protein DMA11_02465 [Marinilabiliaceae bacterium JC017]|nr:hypothetical protein DMA11_02465 [Marinilabiliaceae bacterium JC017]